MGAPVVPRKKFRSSEDASRFLVFFFAVNESLKKTSPHHHLLTLSLSHLLFSFRLPIHFTFTFPYPNKFNHTAAIMSAVPGPVYGLEVPPGEILIPATMEFPASVS